MSDVTTRRSQIDQAVANERLERLVVSEDSRRIADNYVVGQASAAEVAEKIRERYGIAVQ